MCVGAIACIKWRSLRKALRIRNFVPVEFADIIDVERYIFINNCFNKHSFSFFFAESFH